MRKSYAEVQIERIMGEPHSSKDSRFTSRYFVEGFWLFMLITIIGIAYGSIDVGGSPITWFCGLFYGIMIGLGWAHGWPKQVSEGLQLSPSLIHEEE